MDLTYLNGKKNGETVQLVPPGISIGREADNDLQLLIGGISRYHAMISFDGSDWYIEDLGSTNGTQVDKKKILQKTKLEEGAVISIGEQKFRFGADVFKYQTGEPVLNQAAAQTAAINTGFLNTQQDFASQIRKSRNSIFGGSPKTEKKVGTGKKNILSNIIFTLIVITLPLICIFGYMVVMERNNIQKKKPVIHAKEQPFLLYYEKSVITPDNVFRFEAKIENNVAVFTVDDLKYGRHNVVKQGDLKKEQLETLKDSIRNTGFMQLSNEPTNTPVGPEDEQRKIIIALDSAFNTVTVRNTFAQTSFESVETAIADFAEMFDVRVDSLTEEEMRDEAESSFRRAEELLANYQAAPENIRNAILRYKNAMKYYEQFEPKPREWDICRKQLLKAENIFKQLYEGLVFNIQRYYKLRQFDKASEECRKILELVEPDSQEYAKYKKYKVAFDRELRRKK